MQIPRATYRLQFAPGFTFDDAAPVVGYLSRLGISHVYASPVFACRSESVHGYDVIDPNEIRTEIGGEEGLRRLLDEVKHNGMFWLQDVVPNHMAYDSGNRMLMDIFEKGTRSAYVDFFDVEWNHLYEHMHNKILAPFLGTLYADALKNGDIKLAFDSRGFTLRYYDLAFPLRIETYAEVLSFRRDVLEDMVCRNERVAMRILGVISFFNSLSEDLPHAAWEQQVAHGKKMLWKLYHDLPAARLYIDQILDELNGMQGDNGSLTHLDSLISSQYYRLSFWKVASEEINYRRFFTVNDLISVNVAHPDVFAFTHQKILSLVSEGVFDGLRIDHIDGLYAPRAYLYRLRERAGDTYIIVEKILKPDERLKTGWPVQGTTGYDFLFSVNSLLCYRKNERSMTKIYERFVKYVHHPDRLLMKNKLLIVERHMGGTIDGLAQHIKSMSGKDPYARDITLYGLRKALVALFVHFPVYRTYADMELFDDEDRDILASTINDARANYADLEYELAFLEKLLLDSRDSSQGDEDKQEQSNVLMMFQQYTSPVMAKGFEDTFFYAYSRLISLNEVGGDPMVFGISLDRFHSLQKDRQRLHPYSLNATATHDTKRGEDLRARINVLSEMPLQWDAAVREWARMNRKHKTRTGTGAAPDENDEYFFYQTLVGAYSGVLDDIFIERMKQCCIKSVREAKVHTAWIKTDSVYEDGCLRFVENILSSSSDNDFIESFIAFHRRVAFYGMLNSLTQLILKCTCPGVPDFYQGCELWDFNLVDPDNRRPIDYAARAVHVDRIIEKAEAECDKLIAELLSTWHNGVIKLFLTRQLLKSRNETPELFVNGEYTPLETLGSFSNHIIVFARQWQQYCCITVAPRFLSGLLKGEIFPVGIDVWKDTKFAVPFPCTGRWRDAVTGDSLSPGSVVDVHGVLKKFPVALLVQERE